MSSMDTPRNPLSGSAENLFQLIPPDGSFVGNTTLRKKSGLDEDEYWKARKELEEAALIVLGKGRGGSVLDFPKSL